MKTDKQKPNTSSQSAEREKKMEILNYLKNQQDILEFELKSYEMPLDATALADIRKMEEIILKRQISMLKQHIKAIEYMLGMRK
jgi:hypothetical protein